MAKNPSKVEAEILDFVKIKAKVGETGDAFKKRVLQKLDEVSEDEFDTLSAAAQKWQNQAVAALGKGDPLPPFPADAPAKADKEEDEPKAEPAPKARGSKAKDETEDEPKAEPAPKARGSKAKPEDETGEEEAPAETKGKGAAPKPKADAKPPKAKAEPKERKPSALAFVRDAVCREPEISLEDLKKMVVKTGLTVTDSSISTTRSDTLATLKALKEAKLFDAFA